MSNIINFFPTFYCFFFMFFSCILCVIFGYYNNKELSFYFFYLTLTCGYFLVFLPKIFSPILITYAYYILIFISYHLFFTFSKRFYGRIIIVINQYLNNFEYFKLILWIVFVLITSLFSEPFVFLMVFTPLFGFSLVIGNFMLFFFLLFIWLWMFILICLNKLNIFNNFILKIQNYFSWRACLHFLGNNPTKVLSKRIGILIVVTPIAISIPTTVVYALDQELKTGNYAINRMHEYQIQYPNSTLDQQYKVYQNNYKSHANSSLIGRGLIKCGVMVPGAPEAVIPNYKPDFSNALTNLNKNFK